MVFSEAAAAKNKEKKATAEAQKVHCCRRRRHRCFHAILLQAVVCRFSLFILFSFRCHYTPENYSTFCTSRRGELLGWPYTGRKNDSQTTGMR
jgi:hypothetical protein